MLFSGLDHGFKHKEIRCYFFICHLLFLDNMNSDSKINNIKPRKIKRDGKKNKNSQQINNAKKENNNKTKTDEKNAISKNEVKPEIIDNKAQKLVDDKTVNDKTQDEITSDNLSESKKKMNSVVVSVKNIVENSQVDEVTVRQIV